MKGIYKFPFWFLMIPIILVSSLLVSTKLDAGALTQHEFNSIKHLIWSGNRADTEDRDERILTPEETIESINETSPEHVPAYMLQLSLWTDVVGFDLVVLRVMSFFYYVLSVAMLWRFARDLFDEKSALFAAFILAFTGYFIFYGHAIRMYAVIVMQVIGILWSYWHIVISQKRTRWYHWLALFAWSVYGIYTHNVVFFVLLAIGLYHIVFVPKNKTWLYVGLVEVLVGVAFLPWLPSMIEGLSSVKDLSTTSQSFIEILTSGLFVYSNGFWLGALFLIGFLIWKRPNKNTNFNFVLITFVFMLIAMLFVNEVLAYLPEQRMRYTLVWLPPIAIIWGFGIKLVYQYRQWLAWGMLAVWIVMLAWFNSSEAFYVISNLEHQEFRKRFPYHLAGNYIRDHYDHLLGFEDPLVTFNSEFRPSPGSRNYYEEVYQRQVEYLSLPIQEIGVERFDKIDDSFPGFWFSYRIVDENAVEKWKSDARVHEMFDGYAECISVIDNEQVQLIYYLDNRVPCSLILGGDKETITYENDYVLRNYVVVQEESQVSVSLLWHTPQFKFDNSYGFSIQVFHDGKKVGQTDYPIDDVVTHQIVEIDDYEHGIYSVQLILYSSDDIESVAGFTEAGAVFEREFEIGQFVIQPSSM